MIGLRTSRRSPHQTPQPSWDAPIPLTSTDDGRTHLINQPDHDNTLHAGTHTYPTLCGHLILAAALTTPPGPHCHTCHDQAATSRAGPPSTHSHPTADTTTSRARR